MQAELTGTPAPDETSDAVLLLRTREGDTEAFGSLYLRHVAAARVLARQLARDPSEADELVAESFTRVLGVLQRGAGPEAALRPYLLSTMRRLHIDRRVAERKTEPTDDLSAHDPGEPFVDRPADELERTIVSSAFTSLPERWRLVLWHTEVEGLSPAQVAPLLGISANATAALAVRARAGLRDAYLTAHVGDATEPGCREIGSSLGGYVRGTLSRRERAAVDAHLDSCARCSAAVLELSDTAATMRAIIGPLILGSAVLAYREGLLALGPHAIPSFALLHAGGAAAGTGTGTGAGGGSASGSGSGSGAANAGRPTWQLAVAAGVAGAVVIAAAVAYALAGGSPADTASGRPAPGSTSAGPSSTAAPSTSAPTPTPSPSSGSTSPSSSSTSSPANLQVNPVAQTSTTSPASPTSPTSPTSALPALQAPAPSQVTLLTVGDLVAGRDNVLELTTTNPDPSPVTQSVALTLPPGVALSSTTTALRAAGRASNAALLTGAAAAAGPCSRTTEGASCTLGLVAAGATATLRIPVTLADSFSTGDLSLTVTSRDGARTASVTVSRTFTVTPGGVSTTWAGHGRYQVSAGGASLLSCQDDKTPVKGCAEAEARKLPGHQDNNDWTMLAINDAGSPWTTSSSAAVDLPKGSTVVAAWLSWSASGFAKGATPVHTASIAGPDGKPSTVTAKTWDALDVSSASAYVATADVTAQVQAQGGGSWTVGDIALSGGQTSIYAGWSLTVVTTSAAAPVRDVTVLAGPFAITDASHTWSGHAPGLSGQGADLTLVAWEGDADLTGDSLSVHGKPVAPRDSPGVTDNVAASAALGAKRAVSFGVDVRQLSAPAGDGDDISVTTDGDTWILGMLVISAGDGARARRSPRSAPGGERGRDGADRAAGQDAQDRDQPGVQAPGHHDDPTAASAVEGGPDDVPRVQPGPLRQPAHVEVGPLVELGVHEARTHRRHRHPAAGQLAGQRLGEHDHPRLRRRVGAHRDERRDRADVDDRARDRGPASPARPRGTGPAPRAASRRRPAPPRPGRRRGSWSGARSPALLTRVSTGRSGSRSRSATGRTWSGSARSAPSTSVAIPYVARSSWAGLLQSLGVAGDQDKVLAARGQLAGELGAEPGARAGHECGRHAASLGSAGRAAAAAQGGGVGRVARHPLGQGEHRPAQAARGQGGRDVGGRQTGQAVEPAGPARQQPGRDRDQAGPGRSGRRHHLDPQRHRRDEAPDRALSRDVGDPQLRADPVK